MPCLHRYLLKEFGKLCFIIQALILVLFVFIEYLSMMDRFLNSDITLLGALWFVILELPFMFVQVAPASVLLANIFVFGLMNRHNELLALKSSGISVYSLVKPVVFSSLIMVGLLFFLSEILVPFSITTAHDIENTVIRGKKNVLLDKKNIWIKSGENLVHFNFYDPSKKTVAGITILAMGENFQPRFRLDAKKGFYLKGVWWFEKGIQQTYNAQDRGYDVVNFDTTSIHLDLMPEDLERLVKKSEEMGIFELRDYMDTIQKEGYDATRYVVDFHGKIAFPFVCLIMALTGAAFGMKSHAGDNLPMAVTSGIIIAFTYWFFHGFCMSLGYAGSLPPVPAAWISNLFFLCFGVICLIRTE